MRSIRRTTMTAGALALAGVAATCVALAPTAAASAQACVVSSITTGEYEAQGTIRTKAASSCGDLNLTYSYNTTSRNYDYYAGRYKKSTGWVTGSKRYVQAYDGNHSVSDSTYWLVTDISAGTQFSVSSLMEGGDNVQITH
ncbi:hypothetical protein XF35_40485 [Streptomyces platensis subsp. clarensis]|uniref:Lipoprotein n=1 Tax=Streptomyces showdoensis TaxID=68268 RepID=A0A2P2GQC3_STREW|nr:hypothetical protein [Streptomyces showdoensis]KKZ73704.1 hypothetical protein VO63_11340 [Streptomyces showdoensis]MCW7991314.1 hypothetical protein [Streptomyces platensis subsp. clarensis]